MIDFAANLSYATLGINIALFAGTLLLRKNQQKEVIILLAYMVAIALVQLAAWYFGKVLGQGNRHITHFYFAIQFIFLSVFYRGLIGRRVLKRIIKVLTLLVPLVTFSQYLFVSGIFYQFNVLEIMLCSLIPVVYGIIYLYQSLQEEGLKWLFFTSGIVIYLVSSMLVFAGGDLVLAKYGAKVFYNFWLINNFIYVIYQLLTTTEWLVSFRK